MGQVRPFGEEPGHCAGAKAFCTPVTPCGHSTRLRASYLFYLLAFCKYLSGLCSFQGASLSVGVAIHAVVAEGQVWSPSLGQITIALAAGQSPLLEGQTGLPDLL